MTADWAEATLGDLIGAGEAHLQTGPFGTALNASEYAIEGVPLISVGEVRHGHFEITDKTPRVSSKTTERLPQFVLEIGDIVFGRKGGIDRNAIVLANQRGWFLGSDGIRLRLSTKHCGLFFSYQMRSPTTRAWLLQNSEGTTMPSLNQQILGRVPVVVPPLAQQEQIASVLGVLDEKIELNRRMNVTLEAMARALFQSWFVDFDPVRAKLDGRAPVGMDAATAALFPNSFAETLLGHLPKNWQVMTLAEACTLGGGSIQTGPFGTQLHASDYVMHGIPSIMPSDLRDNRIDATSIARIREEDAARLSVYRVQVGDVVYSRRGDVERRSLIRDAEEGWICGTGCLRVRFGVRGLDPQFGASYLGTSESRAWVVRHAVGATMPNLNTSILGALPLVVPPRELQLRFADIVSSWDKRGTLALQEARTLTAFRDALLPKLINGELVAQQSTDDART